MSLLAHTAKAMAVTAAIAGSLTMLPDTQIKAASLYRSPDAYQNYIIQYESSGRPWAVNPYSGACGLMQAYPCGKLANACPDWRVNVTCQLNFFTGYAAQRYGSWYNAYLHSRQYGWW